jgi:omega-amidase
MKIALVSLNQIWEDKSANQLKCKDYVEKASQSGAELIVFPEMTLTGFSMNIKFIREKIIQSPTVKFFSVQAKKNNISVAFGAVFEKDDMATNNLVVIDSTGKLLSNYAKIHPFSFSGENNFYLGGNEFVTCKVSGATIGLTICYDLRFPEIFQVLSKNCNLILTIANWPERRITHWNTLLQARAIENQLFMAGINRTGIDGNNINYIKSTYVFDPLGEKMNPLHSFSDLDIYDLSLDKVTSARASFPVKQDRKTELYKSFL